MLNKAIATTLLFLMFLLPIHGQKSDALDDVLEHVPLATVLALRGCGVQSASPSWTELAASAAAAYTLSAATTWGLKHVLRERRPDGSDHHSLPSGHATMAFAGATVLMKEYGQRSPWIAVGGYGLATLVAADRVRRDRHYVHDVVAGAAIGFAATELIYFLKRKVIKNRNIDLSLSGLQLDVAVRW